ncbi:MAG TPA: hypothetical protein VFI78_00970 [Salinimicrobium sp.]|nr:hypothetical protein [Salinimicrobium sp.]
MPRNSKKYRIFYKLEKRLEIPMFLLAIVWLYLFIVEIFHGLNPTQETLILVIWILFIFEFLVKLIAAPRRLAFIKHNWITVIALLIPALRVFRIFSAIRLLQSVRVINSTKIIRALTSGKRFVAAVKDAQGPQPEPEMNIGVLIAYGKTENKELLAHYAQQVIEDAQKELENSTGTNWFFDITDKVKLEKDNVMGPSDFLEEASLIMSEGPYDVVCVITDVGLKSRRDTLEAGLSSAVTRIMVLSTRKLTVTGRNQDSLELSSGKVRFNSSLLFLHQIGHLLHLKHITVKESKIMRPFVFDENLGKTPSFSTEEKKILRNNVQKAPDRELRGGNVVEAFVFHFLMTLRHIKLFFSPLLRNGALFLPLSLPTLATAAVAPGLLLVFTAEIWDVGFGMTNGTATFFAAVSILSASFYLVRAQSLFLPRKDKRILTEHLAVANSVIYFSIFLACVGLFLMMTGLMLIIEIYIFPAGLMQTWPTLETGKIDFYDKLRLAVFISTVCVTTGALAGGVENRKVIRHLALFRKTP